MGVLAVVGCWLWVVEAPPSDRDEGWIATGVVALLAWRWSRQAVVCKDRRLHIRGLLLDRTVTRPQSVTESGVVLWVDERGRRRRSQVSWMWDGGRGLPMIARDHAAKREQLARWIRSGRV